MRVMRGNLLDVLRQPYIEAARAKGVPGHKVVLKHAVPNALHPLVMYQGVAMPYMLSGELEVAIVLGIPTIGPLMLDSLYRNDIWVTTTIFLWLSAVLVVANLAGRHRARPARPAHAPGGCDMSAVARRPTRSLPGTDPDPAAIRSSPTSRRRRASSRSRRREPMRCIADAAAPALRAVRSQTYLRLVWRRFRRNTHGHARRGARRPASDRHGLCRLLLALRSDRAQSRRHLHRRRRRCISSPMTASI